MHPSTGSFRIRRPAVRREPTSAHSPSFAQVLLHCGPRTIWAAVRARGAAGELALVAVLLQVYIVAMCCIAFQSAQGKETRRLRAFEVRERQ